jgi:Trk K+ transport system NAD-binding subunit
VGHKEVMSQPLGEGVTLYEVPVPKRWAGKSVAELVNGFAVVVASVVRRGHGMLPNADLALAEGDRLLVSATIGAHNQLLARMEAGA